MVARNLLLSGCSSTSLKWGPKVGPDRQGRLGPPAVHVGDFEDSRQAGGRRWCWRSYLVVAEAVASQESDAREIMSGVLRRGPPTVCERRAGRSDPPLRRLRRPSGRPRGGSLLPVVSCARVSISHSNRHKWRRDELRTGRRFARGLSQQLREEARQSHPRLISG